MKKVKWIILIVVIYFGMYFYLKILSAKELFLTRATSCIKLYIIENEGCLPKDKNDMLEKGYLFYEDYGGHKYVRMKILKELPSDFDKEISSGYTVQSVNAEPFDYFKISYGASLESIVYEEGRLKNAETGKDFFIITGPTRISLTSYYLPKKYYMSASVDLYKEMLKRQNPEPDKKVLPQGRELKKL